MTKRDYSDSAFRATIKGLIPGKVPPQKSQGERCEYRISSGICDDLGRHFFDPEADDYDLIAEERFVNACIARGLAILDEERSK